MAGLWEVFTKAIARVAKHATDAIDRTARNLGHNSSPDSEQETDAANERDLNEGAKDYSDTAREAAGDKARDDIYKVHKTNPVTNFIIETSKKVRDTGRKLRDGAARTLKKKTAAVCAGVVVAAAVTSSQVYLTSTSRESPPPSPHPIQREDNSVNGIVIPPPLPEVPSVPDDLAVSDADLNDLLARLNIRDLSLSALGRERLNLDTSDPPAIIIPEAIAAASAAPMTVTASSGARSSTVTTTVGQFYEAAPEDLRDEIADHVRDHGSSGIHVDIDVRSDFAGIRIRS